MIIRWKEKDFNIQVLCTINRDINTERIFNSYNLYISTKWNDITIIPNVTTQRFTTGCLISP